MSVLAYILFFTFLGSIVALVGGVLLLYWQRKRVEGVLKYLVSFAIGTLLAATFFDLFPEAAEATSVHLALLWGFYGLLLFFFLEKVITWHYCHEMLCRYRGHKHVRPRPFSYLLIFADTVHNFIDGVLIAATFLLNIPLGIITAIAVFCHEIPQEIGDFAVLLYAKMPRFKVLLYNILSAAAAFVGAVATYFVAPYFEGFIPLLAAFAGGGFLYIALADLAPETHAGGIDRLRETILQIFFVLIGVFIIYGVHVVLHAH